MYIFFSSILWKPNIVSIWTPKHIFNKLVGYDFMAIQPWLFQLITSALPGCICNYCEQVHHSATSPWSYRFNLEMLPGILTPLITTASSTFNHRDEAMGTSGRPKAHNYFPFYSGKEDRLKEEVVFPPLRTLSDSEPERNWLRHRGRQDR